MAQQGLNDELKALLNILHHNGLVRKRLVRFANVLLERAEQHDLSKFSLDEFEGFVEIKRIGRAYTYGSKSYDVAMKSAPIQRSLQLHHERNPHHPDHHANMVADMTIFDMIEMVVDWLAACDVYGTTLENVIPTQIKDYNLSAKQVDLIKFIAKGFE